MGWEVEYTDQFGDWWDGFSIDEQEDIIVAVHQLEVRGPVFGYPTSSGIKHET